MSTQTEPTVISIPVRPIAGTAANLGTLAGLGIVAGGATAVGLAAAGAAGLVGLNHIRRRAMAKRREMSRITQAATRTTPRATGSRAGAGSSSGRTASGRPAAGSRAGGASGASPSSTGRSSRNPLAAAGRAVRSAVAGRGSAGSGSSGGRSGRSGGGYSGGARSGSGGRGSRSLAARAHRVANSPARRWAAGHLRAGVADLQSRAARSRQITRDLQAAVGNAARRWVQERLLGRTPPKVAAAPPPAGPVIGAKLTGGLATVTQDPDGTITVRIAPPLTTATPAPVATPTTLGENMLELARKMSAYAAEYDADGLLQVMAELEVTLYPSLLEVRSAFESICEKSKSGDSWGMQPSVVQLFNNIIEALGTAADQARKVVPEIYETEQETIKKLQNATNADRIRDVSANERRA